MQVVPSLFQWGPRRAPPRRALDVAPLKILEPECRVIAVA
jgi:hypothetical protein